MKQLLKRNNLLTVAGAAVGGLAGFGWWYYIGCASGACPITSSPYLSVLWGMMIGGLLVSSFRKEEAK